MIDLLNWVFITLFVIAVLLFTLLVLVVCYLRCIRFVLLVVGWVFSLDLTCFVISLFRFWLSVLVWFWIIV